MKNLFLSMLAGLIATSALAADCEYTLKIYTTSWCGPCRAEKAMLHEEGMDSEIEVQTSVADHLFCVEIIDLGQHPDETVTRIPTHRVYHNDSTRMISERVGSFRTKLELLAYLTSVIPE